MIPMTMIGKVRRMFHRQNKSVREIARLTSLSRNTISKYLSMDVQEEPKYQPTGCGFYGAAEFVCEPRQAWSFDRRSQIR